MIVASLRLGCDQLLFKNHVFIFHHFLGACFGDVYRYYEFINVSFRENLWMIRVGSRSWTLKLGFTKASWKLRGELSSRFGDGTFLKELMLSATSQGYLSLRLPKYLGDHCSWNKIWWREHFYPKYQPHGDFFYQPPPTHKPLFGCKVGIVMKIWRGVSEAKIRELALEKSWMHEARTSEK